MTNSKVALIILVQLIRGYHELSRVPPSILLDILVPQHSWHNEAFTLEAQVKLSSGSAQKFLSRASVKCPNVIISLWECFTSLRVLKRMQGEGQKKVVLESFLVVIMLTIPDHELSVSLW